MLIVGRRLLYQTGLYRRADLLVILSIYHLCRRLGDGYLPIYDSLIFHHHGQHVGWTKPVSGLSTYPFPGQLHRLNKAK